jgi:hypothetical protein|tara:strand:+ start:25514 stop:25795 length:282 start_codon:yes stop_codon:yes gene_type:complete
MYKLKKENLKYPEPYQEDGDGADLSELGDDGTDVSEIDYPGDNQYQSEIGYDSSDESNSDLCSTDDNDGPTNIQYKNLESNLEEETDFAEINF